MPKVREKAKAVYLHCQLDSLSVISSKAALDRCDGQHRTIIWQEVQYRVIWKFHQQCWFHKAALDEVF
jgi:hypothetical protein